MKKKLDLKSQKTSKGVKEVHISNVPITSEVSPLPSRHENNTGFCKTLPQSLQYAGFWLRFLAFVIDSLIFAIAGIILGFFVGQTGGSTKSLDMPFFIISWLYYALMESSHKRATLGKIVLGISVTDLSGHRISFGRATGRYFGKIISGIILSFGYIMAAFTTKKQALHDIMASTLVIKN